MVEAVKEIILYIDEGHKNGKGPEKQKRKKKLFLAGQQVFFLPQSKMPPFMITLQAFTCSGKRR